VRIHKWLFFLHLWRYVGGPTFCFEAAWST
jgi:hypothetical protein